MSFLSAEKKGYTFVEIIIVVVILAILAALVVPRLGGASTDPDLAALAATLQMVRTQLQYYKLQQCDRLAVAAAEIQKKKDTERNTDY